MLLKEQTPAEKKKIQKYKDEGYTELTQAAWKKKKKEDPNGDFVNVGTYYYGYKAGKSNTENKDEEKEKKKKEEEKKKKRETLKNKYPSTGLGKDEGNEFRKWMKDHHPNFKDENSESLSNEGDPDNGTIRQAWKEYKDEYQGSTDTEEVKPDDLDNQTNDDENKPSRNVFDIPCDEWDENVNWFYTEFPDLNDDQRKEKSKSFYNWLQKKYGTFFLNFESEVEQNCGTDLMDPKSPFLQHWALRRYSHDTTKTNFEAWSGKPLSESKKTWLRLIESLDPNFIPKYTDYSRKYIFEVFSDAEDVLSTDVVTQMKYLCDDAESINLSTQIEMGDNVEPSTFQDIKIFFDRYVDAGRKELDMYFGNPLKKNKTADIYQTVSKFWYGYLLAMVFFKRKFIESYNFLKRKNRNRIDKYLNKIEESVRALPNPWKVVLHEKPINPDDDPKIASQTSLVDETNTLSKELQEAEKYIVRKENNIIRKKLLEMKSNKNITHSIKNKLISKKQRVNKLVESMEIIYMDLYLGKTDRFFSRMLSLYETSKKSNRLIGEDIETPMSDFETAFRRVYTGAEDDVKQNAIPYFIEKLGVEGEVRYCVENELNKIPPMEIQKIFTDTEDIAEKVLNCVVSTAGTPQGSPMNVMDAIENVMIDSIDTSDVKNKLKKQFIEIIRPIQDESSLKVQEKADQVVQAIIQTLSSKS